MKYDVTIEETFKRTVTVEADSIKDAENKVKADYWLEDLDCDFVHDSDDLAKVEFFAEEQEKIKVVMIEPGKKAYIEEIATDLDSLQKAVDGMIETAYYFEDPDVCLVCNEEGKITGLPFNRAIYDDFGGMLDVVMGKCFICDCSGENFASLPEEKLNKYLKEFELPERLFRVDGHLNSVKYNPDN